MRDRELSLSRLPAYAREVGVSTFGSIAALDAVLNNTKVQHMDTLNGQLKLRFASFKGDGSVRHLKNEFKGDRYEVLWFKQHGKTDGVVVDVGANLGYFSITMAKLYPRMRVISVEPSPPTHFFFVLNVHLNRLRLLSSDEFRTSSTPGVLPLHSAIGGGFKAEAGRTVNFRFPVGTSDSQNAAIDMGGTPRALPRGWREQRVPLTHMPTYLEERNVQKVRVMKIDCEGCEWKMIPSLWTWLPPPIQTAGMKYRYWTWPSLSDPYLPRIERIVGEMHTGGIDTTAPCEDGKRKSGIWPTLDELFMFTRILTLRGCNLGLPGHIHFEPC